LCLAIYVAVFVLPSDRTVDEELIIEPAGDRHLPSAGRRLRSSASVLPARLHRPSAPR